MHPWRHRRPVFSLLLYSLQVLNGCLLDWSLNSHEYIYIHLNHSNLNLQPLARRETWRIVSPLARRGLTPRKGQRMESKKPSTVPNNLRDSIFKLSDADIIAGDLTAVLSDMLVRFESDSVLDVDKFVSQIKTVLKATEAIQENIQEGIKLSGHASFSASYKSEKLASDKSSKKREDLRMNKKQRKNTKSLPLRRLENVASIPNKRSSPVGIVTPRDLRKKQKDIISGLPLPKNGQVYSLLELVNLMRVDTKSSIFGLPVTRVHDALYKRHPRLFVACYKTLGRAIKDYEERKKLPIPGNEGIKPGRPPLVPQEALGLLNEGIHNHVGKVETREDLSKSIVAVIDQRYKDQNIDRRAKMPSRTSQKKYNLKASVQPGVALTKLSGTRPQGARRQMASTSLRNLVSHMLTVGLVHFTPGKFKRPENLSPGAIKFLDLMKAATGIEMKPIHPWQIINYDASSYYAFLGTRNDNGIDEWGRISEGAISRGTRSIISLHRCEESTKCDGLMLRWIDGIVGSGQVLPMVQLYTGFDDSEMPVDRLIVLEVEGMTVNANLDARMEGVGYIVFKRQGTSMAEFYEWYENEVVYPSACAVRRAYNVFDVSDDNEQSDRIVSDADASRVWIDSDMEQIKRITDLEVAERNLSRGLTFAKIGAKFTSCVQACDRHTAFKIKRNASRTTTVKDKMTPLKMTLENGMQKLQQSGRLILSRRKRDVIVDAGATGPAMQGKAYDEEKNRAAFVSAGFLDEGSQTCPDLDGIEAATNINFERNPHYRTILNQTLVRLMRHAYRTDELAFRREIY